MDIPAYPASAPSPSGQSGTGGGTVIDSDFETFLNMLTTQLRHQDPLNPMEATDFAVQLATFSGVEQQVRTNQLLEGLTTQAGIAELAGLVGLTARAPVAAYYEGDPVDLSFAPAAEAEAAELLVYNAMGNEVERIEVEPDARAHSWDGLGGDGNPRPTGSYSFEIVSFAGGEQIAGEPAEVYAPIIEARQLDDTQIAVLPGGIEVDVSQISALRQGDTG